MSLKTIVMCRLKGLSDYDIVMKIEFAVKMQKNAISLSQKEFFKAPVRYFAFKKFCFTFKIIWSIYFFMAAAKS